MYDVGLLEPAGAGTPTEEAVSDLAYLQAMLDAEAALARAQAGLGLIPAGAAERIGKYCDVEYFNLHRLATEARSAGNPVVPLVKELRKMAGEHVHQGATSQDIVDSATMLVAARTIDLILPELRSVSDSLAQLATRHRTTVIAGRTLSQHAVPTTFGLKAAGWMTLIDDACERLDTVRDSLPAQLGGAAGTLAALSIDQVAPYARELGLVEPVVPWHTLRTPIADLGAALAFVSGALGKFALDVTMLAATEVGEVAEPAAAGRGGSSAMPHKRNPVLATMIVSAARQVPSYTSVLMQSMLAEHERPAGAWHAEWQPLRGALRLVGGAAFTAAELAAGLTVDAERMRRNLDLTHGLIVSERLAGALAEKYGAESAKHLMTRVSAEAVGLGLPLREILAEENLPEELFNPANYTGEAEVLVDRALAAHARRSWK